MSLFNNKALVSKCPIITTILLEGASVGQIVRMFSEHSAKGQNVWSWLSIDLALLLWWNWYRVMTPEDKIAKLSTVVGMTITTAVVLTVVYFRWHP